MNEEDYEVDENRKPASFRQRISMKNEEVWGVFAGGGLVDLVVLIMFLTAVQMRILKILASSLSGTNKQISCTLDTLLDLGWVWWLPLSL